MFWIYIPPIILVAALATLAVILGRKSSDYKKLKDFRTPAPIVEKGSGWKSRLNSIGRSILHILEKILVLARLASKRTEQSVSLWASKLRARRNGKKFENISPEDLPREPNQAKIIQEIERTEDISANLTGVEESARFASSEVVVRRKIIHEPVIIPKKEPLPEDKVRESALIYRIAENPKDIEAYRELGDYYMAVGNIKDAKESFKMVLKLRPRDLKAKSSLREIEMKIRLGN